MAQNDGKKLQNDYCKLKRNRKYTKTLLDCFAMRPWNQSSIFYKMNVNITIECKCSIGLQLLSTKSFLNSPL